MKRGDTRPGRGLAAPLSPPPLVAGVGGGLLAAVMAVVEVDANL